MDGCEEITSPPNRSFMCKNTTSFHLFNFDRIASTISTELLFQAMKLILGCGKSLQSLYAIVLCETVMNEKKQTIWMIERFQASQSSRRWLQHGFLPVEFQMSRWYLSLCRDDFASKVYLEGDTTSRQFLSRQHHVEKESSKKLTIH